MPIPKQKPEYIIGRTALADLLAAGYRVVPRHPTHEMLKAAVDAMAFRRQQMGEKWHYVSNTRKAAIRWAEMLGRWNKDHQPSKPWKRWTVGRWLVVEIDKE